MGFAMSRDLYNNLAQEFEVRDDYSGRCMYGRSCFGFTGFAGDVSRFFGYLHELAAEDIEDCASQADEFLSSAPEMSWDSMGLETIFYFPGVTVEEEDPDEKDEEDYDGD